MAACGNEEGLTVLDYCGGPKEGGYQGAVMKIDLLFQTRGASKSIQNTADRQVTPCLQRLPLHVKRPSSSKAMRYFSRQPHCLHGKPPTKTTLQIVQCSDTPQGARAIEMQQEESFPPLPLLNTKQRKRQAHRDMLSSVLSVTDVTAGTFRDCQRRKTKTLQMPRLSAA